MKEFLSKRESGRSKQSQPSKRISTRNLFPTDLPESDTRVESALNISENVVEVLQGLQILDGRLLATLRPAIPLPSPNPFTQTHLGIV